MVIKQGKVVQDEATEGQLSRKLTTMGAYELVLSS